MRKDLKSFQPPPLPRYHVMMDFPHVQGRRWVILEEEYLAVVRQRDRLLDEIEILQRDGVRLDALQLNCWDVRFMNRGEVDDTATGIEIVSHFANFPVERVVGENYSEDLRAAIDQARTADADPPVRPKYGKHGRRTARHF
ncbi:hypothetical protein ACFW0H_25950 [Pseudomonas sp. CR3202]|uniref:hypothetical protein n=1 Tax=Pseudomonas sp. CR3202 TaxID=3351532 RepID=UPI003BF2A903